jgi:hypothetical protein
MRSIIFAVNTKVVDKEIMNKPLLLKGNKKYIYVQKVFKKSIHGERRFRCSMYAS